MPITKQQWSWILPSARYGGPTDAQIAASRGEKALWWEAICVSMRLNQLSYQNLFLSRILEVFAATSTELTFDAKHVHATRNELTNKCIHVAPCKKEKITSQPMT